MRSDEFLMIGIFAVRTFRGWGRPRRKWEASWGLEYATILQWLIHCKNREENEKQAHRESVIHIHFMSQFCKKINHRIEKHCKTCERDWSEVVAIYAPQQEHRHATNSLGMKIPLSILPSLQSTHSLSTSIIRENTQILCLEHILFPIQFEKVQKIVRVFHLGRHYHYNHVMQEAWGMEHEKIISSIQPVSCHLLGPNLVRGRATLVELRKAHADPHWVLQVLLSASLNTCLLLLVQSLPTETLYAVTEASLYQRVVHLQTGQKSRNERTSTQITTNQQNFLKCVTTKTSPSSMHSSDIVFADDK